tara:strand:- start:177 stop:659 length:483 start_codon:yes stop_codon:yes gene_type:complete
MIFKNNSSIKYSQNGAALVIGLILLVIITILGISGMNTATTELAIARNDQNMENAFQASEAGIEEALAIGEFSTIGTKTFQKSINTNDSVTTFVEFKEATLVPDRAFSLGVGSGISAYHFIARAAGSSKRAGIDGNKTDRDASAFHTQGFYIVGPERPIF